MKYYSKDHLKDKFKMTNNLIKKYFENPAFRSDGMKVYPTLVIRGTGLYELWKTGRYQNYTPDKHNYQLKWQSQYLAPC